MQARGPFTRTESAGHSSDARKSGSMTSSISRTGNGSAATAQSAVAGRLYVNAEIIACFETRLDSTITVSCSTTRISFFFIRFTRTDGGRNEPDRAISYAKLGE